MEAALCRGRTKREDKLLFGEAPFFPAPSPGKGLQPNPCVNGLLQLLPRCLGW